MKKIVTVILTAVLVLGLTGAAFAQIDEKKAELDEIRANLVQLDSIIADAKAKKQTARAADFIKLKKQTMQRAQTLKDEIAALEPAGTTRAQIAGTGLPWEHKAGLQFDAGYAAGAGLVGVTYVVPKQNNDNNLYLLGSADVCLGAGYSVLVGKVGVKNNFGDKSLKLTAGLAQYSNTSAGIPGLSGEISSGSHLDIGVAYGQRVGDILCEIGYGTALGVTATISLNI